MNEEREQGMLLITVLLWAIIMVAVCAMCSCTGKKVVTEYVSIHDTVSVIRTDTVKDVKVVQKTDTVRQKEVHTITLNNVGDTVKEVHHYHEVEKLIVVDSTDRYRAVVDSLRAVIEQQKNKESVRTKSFFSDWQVLLFMAAVLLILATVILTKTKTKIKG